MVDNRTYDPRGRQVSAPGRQVAFTEANLPRSITTSAGTTTFAYDATDTRVVKTGPSGTVITLDGLYERRQIGGSVQHVFYVHGGEGLVAQVTYDQVSGDTRTEYMHRDPLGSVGAITDDKGEVLERLYYEPFGARQNAAGDPVSGPTKDVLLGFTGHRHDDDLSLIDMRGRVYDPKIRRFLTPDPHVTDPLFGQSYNAYSYVVNNPTNLVDPTGFDWWSGGCIGSECFGGGGLGLGFGFFSFSFGSSSAPSGPTLGSPPPSGSGTSGAHYLNALNGKATLSADQYKLPSLPVSSGATATPVMGPPIGQAWANPFGADFNQQIQADLAELIAFNNEMWHANAPVRAFMDRLATEPGLRDMVDRWWRLEGGTGSAPFEYAVKEVWFFDECMRWAMSSMGSLKVVGAGAGPTVAMYRAVSPAEFADVMKTGQFRPAPGGGSLVGKQFGLKLEEVLKFTDHYPDAAAIIKVEVPESVFKQFDYSRSIDPFIFRNGVVTVQPGAQQVLLNQSLSGLEHVF